MRRLAERVEPIVRAFSQEPQWLGRLPSNGQVFREQAEGWSRATAMHSTNGPTSRPMQRTTLLEAARNFVDGSGESLLLGREALSEFATVTLALRLESE